jgi:hypothetical protein
MKGTEFIQSEQQSWARRKGLELVGSTIPDNRGKKNYVTDLRDNLFEPLSKKNLESFKGNEIGDDEETRSKMNALHSSSALVVNVFQYWESKADISPIVYACGLCPRSVSGAGAGGKITFEEKLPINGIQGQSPHIDILIEDLFPLVYAVESKFSEPYESRDNDDNLQQYIKKADWYGLPHLLTLAESINSKEKTYNHLDAAQLIKHILGLKQKYGIGFYLLYLWYDVYGEEGVDHRDEIERFASIAKSDKINFSHRTHQEVIRRLRAEFYAGNKDYCDYLSDRYL